MESEIIQTIWEAIKSPIGIIAQPTLGIVFVVQGFRIGWETAFSDRTVKIALPKFVLVLLPVLIGPLWLWVAPLALGVAPYHWPVTLFGGVALGFLNIFFYDRILSGYLNKFLPSKKEEPELPK